MLLDTNVISETTRHAPDSNVLRFLAGLETARVSVVTIHELQFGICRLPPGQRRADLTAAIDAFLAAFDDAVLDVDRVIARRAGQLRADAQATGRALHLADAFIAATALQHRLQLATRNPFDFAGLGVTVVDPWGSIET